MALSQNIRDFTLHTFQQNSCNPTAHYKLSEKTSFSLNDEDGNLVTVYRISYRVFDEVDQNSFTGYDNGKKFRAREFTLRQTGTHLAMAEMSCETNGWQRRPI